MTEQLTEIRNLLYSANEDLSELDEPRPIFSQELQQHLLALKLAQKCRGNVSNPTAKKMEVSLSELREDIEKLISIRQDTKDLKNAHLDVILK